MPDEQRKPNLTVARYEDGTFKHIDEVPSGKACKCVCPGCGNPLIAINSKPESSSKAHHFAHVSGSDCKWGDEDLRHKLAKIILEREKKIMLPLRKGQSVAEILHFDSVVPEARDAETGLIPDCVCEYQGKRLWVEFKRSHEVDSDKAEKIRNAHIDCIEIDINICSVEEESIKELLLNTHEHKIWVYNSETEERKVWKEKKKKKQAEYVERQYIRIPRHYAFDKNGRIVNSLVDDIDNSQEYYCLHCNKELSYSEKDNTFIHDTKNKDCVDTSYIHSTARELLYHKFCVEDEFYIYLKKKNLCKHLQNCPMGNEIKCIEKSWKRVDVKRLGYTICEKSGRLPGDLTRHDLIIRKPESLEDAIIIDFWREDCDMEYNTEYHHLELSINYEDDRVFNWDGILKDAKKSNFKTIKEYHSEPQDIKAQIPKFTLYRSGKCFLNSVDCVDIKKPRANDVITEFVFSNNDVYPDTLRLFGLLHCLEKGHRACYCKLCYYLIEYQGQRPYCKRYKTKQTPHFPLESQPCDCQFFGQNKEFIKNLKTECEGIRIIETIKS